MSKQTELERLMQEKAKLDEQAELLNEQIEAIHAQERSGVLSEVKEKIVAFNLTAAELGFGAQSYKRKQATGGQRGPAAVKYRDPESGATWSGRGRTPRWLADKDRESFAVA